MISAFGVIHKSSKEEYERNKRKGNIARNVALGSLGVGLVNGGVASGRVANSNRKFFEELANDKSGKLVAPKLPKGAAIHGGVGWGAFGGLGAGLVANRVYRRRQKKHAPTKW